MNCIWCRKSADLVDREYDEGWCWPCYDDYAADQRPTSITVLRPREDAHA
jgi:hypothetical protein